MARPVSTIAREIQSDMLEISMGAKTPKSVKQRFPYAWPYLEAMLQIYHVNDNYGADSGVSVVLYFLSNASTWHGENAKRLKAELKALLPK